jgi:hypothetical protein
MRLGPPRVAGVVLSSTVWAGSVAQVPLEQLRVPTLLVHNHDDGCRESPFDYAPLGLTRLTGAPAKELIAVSVGKLPQWPVRSAFAARLLRYRGPGGSVDRHVDVDISIS